MTFGLTGLYKLIVKYFLPNLKKKEVVFTDDYDIVIACGPEQLDQLKVCLTSIFLHFRELPHIFIFTDPRVDMDRCRKAVRWFPADQLNIIRGSDCMSYHLQHKHQSVLSFAKNNPMGLKMGALVQMLNAGKTTIFCDVNTLWYDDPASVVKSLIKRQKFELAMLVDAQPHYDQEFIKHDGLEIVNEAPYFSSGILLVKSLDKANYELLGSLLGTASERSNKFTGETILAYLNKKGTNVGLDGSQFSTKADEPAGRGVIAKNYTNAKPYYFWRDALKR